MRSHCGAEHLEPFGATQSSLKDTPTFRQKPGAPLNCFRQHREATEAAHNLSGHQKTSLALAPSRRSGEGGLQWLPQIQNYQLVKTSGSKFADKQAASVQR